MKFKVCSKCKLEQVISEFWKHIGTKDGLRGDCKTCCKVRGRDWYRKRTVEQRRNDLLRTRYGINQAYYLQLLERQNGKCAICKIKTARNSKTHCLTIDHCHKTGKIRGLLCDDCNIAIAALDTEEKLLTAINYLRNT